MIGTSQDGPVSPVTRIILIAYLCALMFPATFRIGPSAFTGTRTFLTLAIIPALIAGFRRDGTKACDFLILIYGAWAAICFFLNQGLAEGVEPSGSHFIEVVGSYFLAKSAFKSSQDFVFWSKCLFTCVVLLTVPAIIETVTARPVILDALRSILAVYPNVEMPTRMGFDRAQVIFEHPILFGVFCAGAFSPAAMLLFRKPSAWTSSIVGLLVAFATLLSFATGAYLNIIWQIIFISWNKAFRAYANRWRIMAFLAVLAYIAVDSLSNRTPFEVFITYFTFDLNSAYTRVIIWRYGVESVLQHPIFGIGLNDWERPAWLAPSVDNFWLLRAMRFGFPGIGLLLTLVFISGRSIIKRIDVPNTIDSRVAITQLSVLAGYVVSMVTVDLWSGSHTLFFFMLGSINALSSNPAMQRAEVSR